ncbi:hypothetical protein FRC04_007905 [Tulasnella sp. 424]|nr:hypothetical protein FRC04_007905 [Tulasnella sp. 424]KAG8975088.1 hypothetical protein FRC05_006511 [Tulasnella sp. 425]
MAQPIATVLVSAARYDSSVSQIAGTKPVEVKKEIYENKNRWLVCTVKNMTDFPILSMANYMDSGRYDDSPQRVEPFEIMTFTCCEKMWGVSGGHSFCINLDSGNQLFFALGFTNPYAGTLKASVEVPADSNEIANLQKDGTEGEEAKIQLAKQAYGNCTESPKTIKSPAYQAKDEKEKDVVFHFEISASSGTYPVYNIKEVREYRS